jgi:hypothetical protein
MSRFLFWCKITEATIGRNGFFSSAQSIHIAPMAHQRRFILLLSMVALLGGVGSLDSRAADPAEKVGPVNGDASAADIMRWIGALDDNRYLAREEATQHLIAAGSAALDPILAIANSDQPEPADRAIWILRRLSNSRDNDLGVAALEHLAQLKGRPALVAKAEAELDDRSIATCERRLAPLGAEIAFRPKQIDATTVANVLQVHLDSNWHGTPEDLSMIAKLPRQFYFELDGAAFDDSVAKMFETKKKLAYVMFSNTKVSPAAIDSLKQQHPDSIVMLRNQAMLGLSGQAHKSGVQVTSVLQGAAAAAAGIVVGDVIATIDGHPLPDFDRLTVRIAQHKPGDKIDMEIIRGEEKSKITVTLGSWAGQG